MTRQIKPMLALKKDVQKLGLMTDDMWVGQEKFDGERVLYQITDDASILTGRRLGKNSGLLAIKTDHVPHLHFPQYMRQNYAGTVLDGELIHPAYHIDIKEGFRKLSRVMRSLPEKALKLQEEDGWLEYHVYDILEYKGRDLRNEPYSVRQRKLNDFFLEYENTTQVSDIFRHDLIHQVYTANSTDEKEKLYETVLNAGKEGIMLRYLAGKYEEGKKSHHLIKVKEEHDIDAVAIRFTPADRAYSGKTPADWNLWAMEIEPGLWTKEDTNASPLTAAQLQESGYEPVSHSWFFNLPGNIVFGCYKDGVLTERGGCSGFDYETAFDMRDNPEKWIGEVIEVHCYGFYPSGKLRHPGYNRLRYDKSPDECIWE